MKMLIASIAVCLLVQPAVALLDDGEDSLGCYFDTQGDVNCFDPTPGVPFTLYFILANPTATTMWGFGFAWRFEPPLAPEPTVYDLVLPPNSLNLGDEYNFLVGFGTDYLTSSATLLASCTVLVLGEVPPGQGIAIGPSTPCGYPPWNAPVYGGYFEELFRMNYSTWPAGQASGWWTVASLDCDAQVVAGESATWGAVKSLYR